MKKTALIPIMASVLFAGCYLNRDVDLDVNTDRYALNICSVANYRMKNPELDYVSYYDVADTSVFGSTIPQLAFRLAIEANDSTTMYLIDQQKQTFLPSYVYTLVDHDTTQPDDYVPLLNALMAQGLLRADTTYKPMLLLEIITKCLPPTPSSTTSACSTTCPSVWPQASIPPCRPASNG